MSKDNRNVNDLLTEWSEPPSERALNEEALSALRKFVGDYLGGSINPRELNDAMKDVMDTIADVLKRLVGNPKLGHMPFFLKAPIDNYIKLLEPGERLAEDGEERWRKNFIITGPVTLAIEVIAAEADGWRAEIGLSEGGKVIENGKRSPAVKSVWSKNFEAAEGQAKKWARQFGLVWKPKPYGDQTMVKPKAE